MDILFSVVVVVVVVVRCWHIALLCIEHVIQFCSNHAVNKLLVKTVNFILSQNGLRTLENITIYTK